MNDTTTEKDPTLRTSPEDQAWSHGEYTAANLDAMYGLGSSHEDDEGMIAVEDLTPRIDQQRVSQGLDGDPYLDELGGRRVDEAGLYRDTQEVQTGANEVLADLGMADTPEATVSEREAMNKTTAEVLIDGQNEDSGRLSNEDRRDARNAAIATELDTAMRGGNTEPFEHLPPSVASRVGVWLGEVGRRYGGAEFAPNDEIAEIGAYVAFAEKVSQDVDGETVTHVDPNSGEIVVEATDDVIMRILDDDPSAIALLNEKSRADTQLLKDGLTQQEDGVYTSRLHDGTQKELVESIRRALLTSSAERLAA